MTSESLSREAVLRPGMFEDGCAANTRRMEFDYLNESLLLTNTRPDAVFIGDSITHLWELQAYFSAHKILINRGIGGDHSTNVRRRFEADVLQLKPQLAVMKIGTNDLGWELGQLDDKLSDVVCRNIEEMAFAAQENGVLLAICSILPVWGPSWLTEDDLKTFPFQKNLQIAGINARLETIAAAANAFYVDYSSPMADAQGLLVHGLAEDGVHPHHAGYAIMARVLRETMAVHGIGL